MCFPARYRIKASLPFLYKWAPSNITVKISVLLTGEAEQDLYAIRLKEVRIKVNFLGSISCGVSVSRRQSQMAGSL